MRLLLALALVLAGGAARADEACPLPIKPGYAVGPVRLGMTLEEVKAAAPVVAPKSADEPFALAPPHAAVSFRLGKDKKVESARVLTSTPCLADATERVLDLATVEAQSYAPFPDCSGRVSPASTGWFCPAHGIDLLWLAKGTAVEIRRPDRHAPYRQGPPPLPKPPPPSTTFVPAVGDAGVGDGGLVEAAPPDPCAGNWAPMANLACGFFGRGDSLSVECYPTRLCMGTFAPQAPRHVDLHGADGQPLGPLVLARGGRTVAYRFGKAPAVGTPIRLLFDRDVRVVQPASAYLGPNPPVDPKQDPRVVGAPMAAVVGSREVSNGWVLDLVVPPSAAPPAATLKKKAP